jgi:hypothetical protein
MYASYFANVPSGTMIVLIAATGFVFAMLLGPALRRRESRDPGDQAVGAPQAAVSAAP